MSRDISAERRARMVDEQLVARGIQDERVLAAMRAIPREEFVPRQYRDEAYTDRPLPIGLGQTISQPYVLAVILEALATRGDERMLEVGGGSGYSAAVSSRLAAEVISIEWYPELAESARRALGRVQAKNVEVLHGDGNAGVPGRHFDTMAVHAGAVQPPTALLGQLTVGGRLIVPLRDQAGESLTLFHRTATRLERRELGNVSFVPLLGR